jgi:hypothetical protein
MAQLATARERIVVDRRELADELAKPYERGRYEQWRRIIEVQATIDAIDRAITDERSIKDKGKPVSLVPRALMAIIQVTVVVTRVTWDTITLTG